MPLSKEEGCTEYIVPQVLHISRAPKALALGTVFLKVEKSEKAPGGASIEE